MESFYVPFELHFWLHIIPISLWKHRKLEDFVQGYTVINRARNLTHLSPRRMLLFLYSLRWVFGKSYLHDVTDLWESTMSLDFSWIICIYFFYELGMLLGECLYLWITQNEMAVCNWFWLKKKSQFWKSIAFSVEKNMQRVCVWYIIYYIYILDIIYLRAANKIIYLLETAFI